MTRFFITILAALAVHQAVAVPLDSAPPPRPTGMSRHPQPSHVGGGGMGRPSGTGARPHPTGSMVMPPKGGHPSGMHGLPPKPTSTKEAIAEIEVREETTGAPMHTPPPHSGGPRPTGKGARPSGKGARPSGKGKGSGGPSQKPTGTFAPPMPTGGM
jgi:hypothetical protein